MANITQKISNFPPAPNSQTDTPQEFNAKADSFVHHQSDTYTSEVNTWAIQANGLKSDMNTIKTQMDGIVASIPAGTINDVVIAADKVWSSHKVNSELKINSGTLSSGYWVQFPDGTMICTNKVNSRTTSNTSGAIFKSDKATVFFPKVFTSAPKVSAGVELSTNGASWASATGVTATKLDLYLFGYTNTSSGEMTYTAIGRWK